jgi:hypothetical protein
MNGKRLALAALVALAAVGCGDGVSYYAVKGEVTLNGKPYPDASIEFVPDPDNAAITAGSDVTGPEGNYKITNLGKPGLSAGKYRVLVTPKPPEPSAGGPSFEDEEQRRMALESLGINPAKQAAKEGKPGGEFKAEVKAEPNILDFDVKGKTARP